MEKRFGNDKLEESIQLARQENIKKNRPGSLRVGRLIDSSHFAVTHGFVNVVVTSHNQHGLGASLSPYKVSDDQGRLHENLWQFAKVYESMPEQKQGSKWKWPAETHVVKGEVQPNHWKWREAGMKHKQAVRYPVGKEARHKCLYALWPKNYDDILNPKAEMEKLGYVEGRKRIYAGLYVRFVKKEPEFEKLRNMLADGYNLQILDVDGPDIIHDDHGTAVPPTDQMTVGKYGESGVGSIEVNENNIRMLLNETRRQFGHGFCLATALLGKEEWLK